MKIENKDLSKLVDIIINKVFPQKIVLFGSRAKGSARDTSDYDIFVLLKNAQNTRKIEKELYLLMVAENIGLPVDLIVATREKFDRLKDDPYLIYHQVAQFGKTLYEYQTPSPTMA